VNHLVEDDDVALLESKIFGPFVRTTPTILRALGGGLLCISGERRQAAVSGIDDQRGASARQVAGTRIPPVWARRVVGGRLTIDGTLFVRGGFSWREDVLSLTSRGRSSGVIVA
jgi:hypothetical protein